MKYILSFFLVFLTSQCSHLTEKTLYKQSNLTDPVKYITLMGNEKTEYFINAEMLDNDSSYHYNIRFLESGKIMNVLKYDSKYFEMEKSSIESERSMQFLISDTLDKWGPTYFGESTSGFYDTFVVNNILSKPNLVKRINKISDDEKRLFHIIDSLAKVRNINIKKVDSIGVIGWFKYEF
jgi:hypothetical protein